MQVKSGPSETSAKTQTNLISLMTVEQYYQRQKKTVTAFVDHSSEWSTAGTVIPVEKSTEAASLMKSDSFSTVSAKMIAVRVTNTTNHPI